SRIARVSQGKESVRHAMEIGGSGQLVMKTEGQNAAGLTIRQGSNKTWLYDLYAGEMTMTFELARDNKVTEIQKAASAMGRSVALTPEYIFAQFMSRWFNTSYPATADGKPVIATNHTIVSTVTTDGTNALATAAALSEASLEDMYTLIMVTNAADGMLASMMPEKLVVPAAMSLYAKKLAMKGKTLGSANNDPKVVGDDLSEVVTNPYLDAAGITTYWFVMTDWEQGGVFWEWDIKGDYQEDNNIHSLNKTYLAFLRARTGCDDWRHAFGTNPS